MEQDRNLIVERERAEAIKNIKQFAEQLAQCSVTLCEEYNYTAQEVVMGLTYLLEKIRQGLGPELIKKLDESFKIVTRPNQSNLLRDLEAYIKSDKM